MASYACSDTGTSNDIVHLMRKCSSLALMRNNAGSYLSTEKEKQDQHPPHDAFLRPCPHTDTVVVVKLSLDNFR